MAKDKYSAVWLSHTSIRAFLECPRAYYLKNVYKDPKTGHKVMVMSPPLSMGQAVHEVIEALSTVPTDKRFLAPLTETYDKVWEKISGKIGGYQNASTEKKFKERGRKMLVKLQDNPGPLTKLAVKIKSDLPYFWLSEEENIILCGKIDWLEYLKSEDSVHIIDFKTGKYKEDSKSLQLPIYKILAENTQKRPVSKISYWYLELNSKPEKAKLPDTKKFKKKILEIGKKVKLARQLERFPCPHKTGCRACTPYEKVLRGEAEFAGVNEYKQDVYVLPDRMESKGDKKSEIL